MERTLSKILLTCILLVTSVLASVTNKNPSLEIVNSKTPIVDIRTPSEWKDTGLLKGAIPIMFFDGRGGYDLKGFLKELHAKVDTTKPFALICRSGARTTTVSKYLSDEYGYKIINLKGGMNLAKAKKLPTTPYK